MYQIMATGMMDTTGVSMPEELIETIDENAVRLGYRNRSDFLRAAATKELERNDVDVDQDEQ